MHHIPICHQVRDFRAMMLRFQNNSTKQNFTFKNSFPVIICAGNYLKLSWKVWHFVSYVYVCPNVFGCVWDRLQDDRQANVEPGLEFAESSAEYVWRPFLPLLTPRGWGPPENPWKLSEVWDALRCILSYFRNLLNTHLNLDYVKE